MAAVRAPSQRRVFAPLRLKLAAQERSTPQLTCSRFTKLKLSNLQLKRTASCKRAAVGPLERWPAVRRLPSAIAARSRARDGSSDLCTPPCPSAPYTHGDRQGEQPPPVRAGRHREAGVLTVAWSAPGAPGPAAVHSGTTRWGCLRLGALPTCFPTQKRAPLDLAGRACSTATLLPPRCPSPCCAQASMPGRAQS